MAERKTVGGEYIAKVGMGSNGRMFAYIPLAFFSETKCVRGDYLVFIPNKDSWILKKATIS